MGEKLECVTLVCDALVRKGTWEIYTKIVHSEGGTEGKKARLFPTKSHLPAQKLSPPLGFPLGTEARLWVWMGWSWPCCEWEAEEAQELTEKVDTLRPRTQTRGSQARGIHVSRKLGRSTNPLNPPRPTEGDDGASIWQQSWLWLYNSGNSSNSDYFCESQVPRRGRGLTVILHRHKC
jgi:hypothetical protein